MSCASVLSHDASCHALLLYHAYRKCDLLYNTVDPSFCCRTLTRSPGMMLVFRSVTLSLASMANVSIVVGLFFLIFAIMGVQLFGGRFWTCNDTSVADKV